MSRTLLQMGPLFEPTQQAFKSKFSVHRLWESQDEAALLKSIQTDCTGVITDGGKGVSNDILDQLPNVKMITVFGVGVDAIDLDYCKAKNITVGNTPDVLSDDVADLAVALALAVCRQVVSGDAYARAGNWIAKGAMPLTTRMSGKTAGIYGMGSIGNSLAQRLQAFNMPVKYCNRSKRADSSFEFIDSLEKLANDVDFLFITAAATASSIGAVNQSVLNALGSSGYLINVARGTLVDETALISSLKNHTIAGAGLDVFEKEPAIPAELIELDNVVLQPHNASGTFETRKAMGDLAIENLEAFFANKSLTAQVV